ncbi:MAG: recombinase family protein [Candidatus Freyarchaeota archaeon]
MKMTRVAGYVRVSTGGQFRNGYSLEEQKQAIEAYAKFAGAELVGIYEDVISGAKSRRPGLDKLKEDAKAGKFDKVVFKSISRFGRNLKDLLELFDYFEQDCSVGLVSLQEQFDTTTPAGRLMRNVLAAVFEFEREMIRERILAGKAEKKAKEGRRAYTGGRPPYGWDAVDGKLVRNEREQTVRRRIKRLYKGGRSLSEIARILNSEGIPPKTGSKWSHVAVKNVVETGAQALRQN